MPWAPMTVCQAMGCGALTRERYCERHKAEGRARDDARRESAPRRGYGRRWRVAREAYLRKHPLCRECAAHGITTAATVVDHIVPHRGDAELFWDSAANWQPLCVTCHAVKSGREGWV